jgi:hypothetical protein
MKTSQPLCWNVSNIEINTASRNGFYNCPQDRWFGLFFFQKKQAKNEYSLQPLRLCGEKIG